MIDAKIRYGIHKNAAKRRGIEFLLTFDQWNTWWLANGIDKNYPTQKGPSIPCMCRYNDQGPYSLDNIYIDSLSNNIKYYYKTSRHLNNNYRNGRQRIVNTPIGQFDGVQTAAQALKVTPTTIQNRIKKSYEGYSYGV